MLIRKSNQFPNVPVPNLRIVQIEDEKRIIRFAFGKVVLKNITVVDDEPEKLLEQKIDKEDIAFLQYTGGTTGGVKAAILSHRNVLANAIQVRAWLGKSLKFGEDIAICALPLYHIFALTCNSIVFFYFGSKNILITNPRDIPGFVKELKKHQFTFISGVNTLFNKLMEEPSFKECDFSKLNISIAGGMPVQKSVGERWQSMTGCLLVVGYGLS